MLLLQRYAPLWLAGLLGEASWRRDGQRSQILALSTMFTEDVFAFYGGKRRFGEGCASHTDVMFIVLITILGRTQWHCAPPETNL
jgi:hypothetical protein